MTKLQFLILSRQSLLNGSQLDKLSDIFINVGNLTFGTIVLPYFLPGIDKPDIRVIGFGVIIGLYFWVVAVIIAKKINEL